MIIYCHNLPYKYKSSIILRFYCHFFCEQLFVFGTTGAALFANSVGNGALNTGPSCCQEFKAEKDAGFHRVPFLSRRAPSVEETSYGNKQRHGVVQKFSGRVDSNFCWGVGGGWLWLGWVPLLFCLGWGGWLKLGH